MMLLLTMLACFLGFDLGTGDSSLFLLTDDFPLRHSLLRQNRLFEKSKGLNLHFKIFKIAAVLILKLCGLITRSGYHFASYFIVASMIQHLDVFEASYTFSHA